jgi:short-subunit dehydrogenase/SAM-dependent methyltransferase
VLGFVTGASSGIGEAFACRLAADGWDLVITARRGERLRTLADRLSGKHGVRVEVHVADLTHPGDVAGLEQVIAAAGPDMLVSTAGFAGYGDFASVDPQVVSDLAAVHVLAVSRLARAAVPAMVARGSGTIINVASVLAFSSSLPPRPLPSRAVYAGAKAFQVAFTQALAGELAGTGVHVQVCCPGLVDTEFHARAGVDLSQVPFPVMEPDEVAGAALTGLRLGEVVCVPGLADVSLIRDVDEAQRAVFQAAVTSGRADRYQPEGMRADPPAAASYALGRDPAESARLERQSEELGPASAALLDRVGTGPGHRAIDLGCGPSGIIELLSARVSPGGCVVGVDADPAHVAMARELAARRGLGNVEIIAADARRTGLPSGSFDLVHARTLLVTVPEPAAVVAEMTRLARPGGWVVGLEPDAEHSLCYPAHPAWDRLGEIFHAAFIRNGADLGIGRRLTQLYREAGLDDIHVDARADVYQAGDSRRTVMADLVRSMRPMISELGLADPQELDEVDRAVREHLDDPHTLVIPHLSFLAWGRKPET